MLLFCKSDLPASSAPSRTSLSLPVTIMASVLDSQGRKDRAIMVNSMTLNAHNGATSGGTRILNISILRLHESIDHVSVLISR
jgi:hypothetical protein